MSSTGDTGLIEQPGVASIKKEFILPISQVYNDRVGNDSTSDQLESSEPPAKRRRGQNKHRPRPVVLDFSKMLCPSLHDVRTRDGHLHCPYGDKCRYMHDVDKFLASKPPDIGDHCHVFETFGVCPYGPACRFAASHLTEDLLNVVEDKGIMTLQDTVSNMLSKDLQFDLRKRKVKFALSEAYLKKQGHSNSSDIKSGGSVEVGVKENVEEEKGMLEEGRVGGKVEEEKGVLEKGRGREEAKVAVTRVVVEQTMSEKEKEEEKLSGINVASSRCDQIECHGVVTDEGVVKTRAIEKKRVDFRGKLYLAPLTTTGNLPFRRICKELGADITCGEMAVATNLLQGHLGEWALVKRHHSEDVFGVQVCGSHIDSMTRCAELINQHTSVDFVDINVGCPIDLIFKKGAGSALMGRQKRFEGIVRGMVEMLDCPVTVKMRTGIYKKNWNAHKLIPWLRDCGVSLVTVHGRSREQRYTKLADWDYIKTCVEAGSDMPVFGNGDVLSYEDYNGFLEKSNAAGLMIARGALIKPWIFTEIKEQRHWDISSSERLEILRRYANYGLEHWGSDTQGVENTRRFLLEWLSFLYRYIPVGLLERVPQRINQRPPRFCGRDELETLLASNNCQDWVKISEMILGPAPEGFSFLPKHKANAYS